MKKQLILDLYTRLNRAFKCHEDISSIIKGTFSPDVSINASAPIERLKGVESYLSEFWKPLQQSFSHIEIQPYIAIEGTVNGKDCVCIAGNYIGNFEKDWLDIPAHGQPIWIRYHVAYIIVNGTITTAYYFIDMLGVIEQVGYHLFPSRGVEFGAPASMTGDGIVEYPTKQEEGYKSYQLVDDMLNALCQYDGKDFQSMGDLTKYWNEHNMMWYGPSGIGTTKGLKGFQEKHQFPFLNAFPGRGILNTQGEDFFGSFGEGSYAVHYGFPAMYGTHTGDGWLGLKASGKKFTMRVMDFWRREDGLLKENWVMIDMIHALKQMDVDVFAMLRKVKK